MKVNSAAVPTRQGPSKSPSQDEIKARIQAKFGVKVGQEKKAKESKEGDVLVSIDSKGKGKVEEGGFGDIKTNSPDSEETQGKLKDLLRSGGFDFNPKERAALNAILNK